MEKCFVPSRDREITPTSAASPSLHPAALDLSVERVGGAGVVRVRSSKLTYPVLSAFFEQVRAIVEGGTRDVLLDLETVSYIDSSAIGTLVEIHRLVVGRGGAVKLVGLQPRVRRMLSMTGVDRFLEVFDGEEEALASLGWPGKAPHRA